MIPDDEMGRSWHCIAACGTVYPAAPAEPTQDAVTWANYEVSLQRAAAIILKLRGCAEDEIDDQIIASLVDHELREPPSPSTPSAPTARKE